MKVGFPGQEKNNKNSMDGEMEVVRRQKNGVQTFIIWIYPGNIILWLSLIFYIDDRTAWLLDSCLQSSSSSSPSIS